jgi:hypothetical protein
MFSDSEVSELRFVIDELEIGIGHDKVIEVAYPIVRDAMGIQMDT